MESPRALRSLLLLCLVLLPSAANVIGCYARNAILTNSSIHLDGREAGDLKYCGDINDGATTCCFKNQECLPNKLCQNPTTGSITREFCSDSSWPEDRCSPVCPGYQAAGVFLSPCDETGTKFCCGDTKTCCGKNTYTEIDKDTGDIIAYGTSKLPTSSSATPAPSSSSAAEADATATDASSKNSSDNGTMNEKTKLGVGLGIDLGVPLVGAIAAALFFWHRSLLAQARAGANGGDDASSPDQMSKVTSPGYENGYGYGQDGTTAAGAVAGSAPGREVEMGYTPVYHQLDAERNTRNELGTSGQAHELL